MGLRTKEDETSNLHKCRAEAGSISHGLIFFTTTFNAGRVNSQKGFCKNIPGRKMDRTFYPIKGTIAEHHVMIGVESAGRRIYQPAIAGEFQVKWMRKITGCQVPLVTPGSASDAISFHLPTKVSCSTGVSFLQENKRENKSKNIKRLIFHYFLFLAI